MHRSLVIGSVASALLGSRAVAQDVGTMDKATAETVFAAKPAYSPYVGRNYPMRPFFGDTHLHTALIAPLPTTGPGGHPLADYAKRNRFAGHLRSSAKTLHALGLNPDQPKGADQPTGV